MKYFIFQGNDHDCGFTSLKILLANLQKDKSYLYMKKWIRKDVFSVNDICKEAKMHGLLLSSYSCDENYYEQLSSNSLTLVRDNHVVFIKKVTPKKITFYDPEVGKVTLKKDEFIAIWCKIILEVESTKNISTMVKTRRSILPPKLRILEAIISLFSVAILVATFYLLNNQQNSVYSVLFLLLFLTALILENFILHKEINFFDRTYIDPYFSRRSNQNKLQYLEFINFKQNYFSNSRNLMSSVLIAFLITFLLSVNDFRNLFALLALVLIKVLEMLLCGKSFDEKRFMIGKYEEKCFASKEQCADYALKANSLASNLASQNSLKQLLYIAVAFGFAIGMMFITGNSGCNYVIFHFGLYYVGFNAYSKLLDGLSYRKEMQKMECRFFDRCNL